MFQFQTGAIRSPLDAIHEKYKGFNSKLVRLEVQDSNHHVTEIRSFNSKLVRLEVPDDPYWAHVHSEFQFQTGSIRR